MNSFSDLGLAEALLRALAEERHSTPTPIQSEAIPPVLAGRDLLGIAQTGTGKTAAFALPILHRLARDPRRPVAKAIRVLVLSPTRELSAQILERFRAYGRHLRLSSDIVIGGAPIGRQIRSLARGLDILVATPGRLVDLMDQGALRLDQVEVLVLDEADHMLDMGFIHAIRAIVRKLPGERQNLFFSATMPPEIATLAAQILRSPVEVKVTPVSRTADRVDQTVMFVRAGDKPAALAKLLSGPTVERALVFTRTKRGADRVAKGLAASGIEADAIHGNKAQNQRERTLASFRDGRVAVLVATDIAARGIDVEGISHVVNYELPNVPESYVHRIGRTARAGAAGIAVSLCAPDEQPHLRAIEKLIKQAVPVSGGTAWQPERAVAPEARNTPTHTDGQRSRRSPRAAIPSSTRSEGAGADGEERRAAGRPQQRPDRPATAPGKSRRRRFRRRPGQAPVQAAV